jgi:ankyrin repeat protein
MEELDFNIAILSRPPSKRNNVIVRYKNICYISIFFKGSKEEAIHYVTNRYTGGVKDDYITKIEELYSKNITDNDVDITTGKNYAIRLVSREGYLDVVKYLVEQGGDITACGNYPIRIAIDRGHLNVVKYLVSLGCEVTEAEDYAIRQAIEGNDHEMIEYLEQCSDLSQ